MTAYKQLPVMSSSSSKQEEIAFLTIVREAAGSNSYVADLFCNKLVDWLEYQITNDFSTNLYQDYYEHACEETRQARADLAQANNRIGALQNEIAALKASIDGYMTRLQEHEDFEAEQKRRLEQKDEAFENLLQAKDELESGLTADMEQAHQEAEKFVAILQDKIRTLKAEIYDLEHPEG